jgi:hypothetical protein
MHLLLPTTMSSQSHLWLRIGALSLLVLAAVWPRGGGGRHGAEGITAAEVTRGGAGRVETRTATAAARLVSTPRTTKLVIADTDHSQLNN